jgi:hypothetical protein
MSFKEESIQLIATDEHKRKTIDTQGSTSPMKGKSF